MDYLIEQALQQVNDENRSIMLQRATDLAMQDLGIMPIHFQFTLWGTKKNVQYTPRTDEYTLAFQFKPVSRDCRSRRREARVVMVSRASNDSAQTNPPAFSRGDGRA